MMNKTMKEMRLFMAELELYKTLAAFGKAAIAFDEDSKIKRAISMQSLRTHLRLTNMLMKECNDAILEHKYNAIMELMVNPDLLDDEEYMEKWMMILKTEVDEANVYRNTRF